MDDIIRFDPVYMERVWGSCNPEDFPHGIVPRDKPVGEAWDISDRPNEQSFVRIGVKKMTFARLLQTEGNSVMGPQWTAFKRFPILVKRLFCSKRLSLQVHPPKNVARHYGLPSKDELWYVLRTQGDAQIFLGLKKGITREQFIKKIQDAELEECIYKFKSQRGDAVFVPSGRLHAIDAGNVMLEIQENSDTTFRVSDWGRVGLDGKPRELHVDQSLQSIDFDDHEPHVINTCMEHVIIAHCDKFRVQQFVKKCGEAPLYFMENEQPRILHVVEGSAKVNGIDVVGESESVILPYAGRFAVTADIRAKILITDQFFSN